VDNSAGIVVRQFTLPYSVSWPTEGLLLFILYPLNLDVRPSSRNIVVAVIVT